ncbi:CBS domain-containing protein [Candidatus Halobeggiatoa sp. HSG11]|nr:CBS domain-containing protein [Candidatus Halobeggiatoa sp. HSG11]
MNTAKLIRVREVMKTGFDRIDGIITVAEALRNMKYPETKGLIVNKRHADDEFGMVLLSDIARHVVARERSPERVNIYEIMLKPVITVSPKMDIRYCARLFDHFNILRAPVVENDDVIGIVGFSDIVLQGLVTIK